MIKATKDQLWQISGWIIDSNRTNPQDVVFDVGLSADYILSKKELEEVYSHTDQCHVCGDNVEAGVLSCWEDTGDWICDSCWDEEENE